MSERPDLGKAMREALPVYEASPALQAWAREEARKLDQESSPRSDSRNGAVSAAVRRSPDCTSRVRRPLACRSPPRKRFSIST